MKKLLSFRQLSLNCDTPQKRPLKKQFSEDFKEWSNYDLGIKISNRFIKQAWIDPIENNEPVIIKKCGENRRIVTGKFIENKDVGKLRFNKEKPNLKIILTQNEEKPQPKIIKPLINDKNFKIKKKIDNQPKENLLDDIKPIVIITAATKREMFQKRTNSAFKELQKPRRNPLIRSSSAPCNPEHIKSNRKNKKNEENNIQINDVVTMVSLISPAGSDCEEEIIQDVKKIKNIDIEKISPEPKLIPKIMSLKKAVKTVSFQQSSIHAIRSFSASFPARRASVSAAMMLSNSLNASSVVQNAKVQEKRCTNSIKPDDDERMPKRRLVRNINEDNKTINNDSSEDIIKEPAQSSSQTSQITNIAKESEPTECINTQENPEEKSNENEAKNKEIIINPDLKSQKEKQCWSMYCKMMEKGINISFDTILRGMLTPTEYRLSRRHSLVASSTETPKNN